MLGLLLADSRFWLDKLVGLVLPAGIVSPLAYQLQIVRLYDVSDVQL